MGKHSELPPSAAARWIECPPSYKLSKDVQETQSIYAAEGSFAHSALEYFVLHNKLDTGIIITSGYDKDMIIHLHKSKEYIDDLKLNYIFIEKSFNILDTPVPIFGTIDFLGLKGSVMHIIDFKYGTGNKIQAKSNPQLMLYAYGAYKVMSKLTKIDTITLTIIQPRYSKKGNYNSHKQNIDELKNWVENEVIKKAKMAIKGEGSYSYGPWCWFCPGKNLCTYLIAKDYEEA